MPVSMPVVSPLRRLATGSPAARVALRGLFAAVLAGCGGGDGGVGPGTPAAPKAVPNFIRLQSDAGDYIGGGRTYEYTQATAVIAVSVSSNVIRVSVTGDQSWNGMFAVPAATALGVGTYTGATRYPFNSAATPGITWFGDGRGCNTATGSFSIDSFTYTSGVLTAVDLRFEQHCEGGTPALRGTIHWRADDPTPPAGPVNPIPANLWKPDPASVPATGTYILLASDPGDYIGQGQFRVYTAQAAPITVRSTGSLITVSVDGYTGEFVAMLGTNPLTTGYYGNLMRYPFHNPVRGGLDWSGNGRGCNRLTGWFAIDRIAYSGTTMTDLEMRFEQHCEEGGPALHGAIRWSP